MRLLIAGGGTGGHIYPALAVASSLRRRPSPPEIAWLGGHRGLESNLVPEAGFPLRRLALRSLRTVSADAHLVLDPIRLGLSVPQALALLVARRPAAVFTTGGYVAIPVLVAARLLGIPSLLWEGNVVPGKSVRATASLATALAVSFGATCRALRATRPCFETGTPIRDVGAVDRGAARERLGVPGTERLIVIFGGSQAVRRFNDAVAEALPELAERGYVIHVTGVDGHAAAQASRDRLPTELRGRYRPQPYLGEGLLEALAAADLVVGRAGSSTLAEATALALPMVVVPYPHAGAHQVANAEIVAAAGAATLIPDGDFDGAALLAATSIVTRPAEHAAMAAASRALGRPGAAAAVADLLVALAERRPLPEAATVEARARAAA
ncbi:MAG TPA: UDP-N-acetylglucosamine--N-acetylmuramyl-(pentapeptide) pyrophosphoryl-undecaprenol N-acetylglucosamine transferase [Candidatus Deferrimicrobiaceae bacterium]|nr:UDP-N-acetylglucosamine--N-acetylmuramyl-(pentapeptide) pyrophosphoryl-undecaprenol N-acetylglucosamine transferase [Candidatus Deferrimicrobiaceae bacterium]